MPSNHLILCHPLPLPPSIFPSIRVFSSESVLHIRWPKYWSFSFSISPSNEYLGLIFFRIDWLDLLAVQGTLKGLLQHHSSKGSVLWCSAFFMVQLISVHECESHLVMSNSLCLHFGSVTKLCPTLHHPKDYSMPGFSVLTISQSLPKFTSNESVMRSNHLILCCPFLLLPSIFPRVFSVEFSCSHQMGKVLKLQLQHQPLPGAFRIDFL